MLIMVKENVPFHTFSTAIPAEKLRHPERRALLNQAQYPGQEHEWLNMFLIAYVPGFMRGIQRSFTIARSYGHATENRNWT